MKLKKLLIIATPITGVAAASVFVRKINSYYRKSIRDLEEYYRKEINNLYDVIDHQTSLALQSEINYVWSVSVAEYAKPITEGDIIVSKLRRFDENDEDVHVGVINSSSTFCHDNGEINTYSGIIVAPSKKCAKRFALDLLKTGGNII